MQLLQRALQEEAERRVKGVAAGGGSGGGEQGRRVRPGALLLLAAHLLTLRRLPGPPVRAGGCTTPAAASA